MEKNDEFVHGEIPLVARKKEREKEFQDKLATCATIIIAIATLLSTAKLLKLI